MGLLNSVHRQDQDLLSLLDDEERKKLVIRKKIFENDIYRKQIGENEAKMNKICMTLSDRLLLKETYLNLDWMETEKFLNLIKQETNEDSCETGSDDEEEISSSIKFMHKVDLPKKLAVKLLICESYPSHVKQTLRRFVSPIMSKLYSGNEFGLFHSSLVIGPWILEYNNSGLCVPRKAVSRAAMLSIDLDKWTTKELSDAIEKISHVIVKWNTEMEYKSLGGNKLKEGNCQDFVDDCLKTLGINVHEKFGGALQNFLRDLREKGSSKLIFHPSNLFRQTFEMKENQILFSSHSQLDNFVRNLKRTKELEMKFEMDFRGELFLLKSFDRAFWLKHEKFPNQEEFKPCDCHFQDPKVTSSNLSHYWG